MTNKQLSEQSVYTFKVGEMFFKSHNYKGVEFTKREDEAFKVVLYKDYEKDFKESMEYATGILNSLGIKDYIINEKTTKTEVSYKTVALAEALGEERTNDEDVTDNPPKVETINITLNVSNMSGDTKDIEGFSKKIADSLKRSQGIR